jgi:hypothetical protein
VKSSNAARCRCTDGPQLARVGLRPVLR